MTNKEASDILKNSGVIYSKGNYTPDDLEQAVELAIKALENDIVPVIIKDGDYEFDGLLDNNRQLLYGQAYTAEYVKDVLGMSWREADND